VSASSGQQQRYYYEYSDQQQQQQRWTPRSANKCDRRSDSACAAADARSSAGAHDDDSYCYPARWPGRADRHRRCDSSSRGGSFDASSTAAAGAECDDDCYSDHDVAAEQRYVPGKRSSIAAALFLDGTDDTPQQQQQSDVDLHLRRRHRQRQRADSSSSASSSDDEADSHTNGSSRHREIQIRHTVAAAAAQRTPLTEQQQQQQRQKHLQQQRRRQRSVSTGSPILGRSHYSAYISSSGTGGSSLNKAADVSASAADANTEPVYSRTPSLSESSDEQRLCSSAVLPTVFSCDRLDAAADKPA
jgi:hypothetical protein